MCYLAVAGARARSRVWRGADRAIGFGFMGSRPGVAPRGDGCAVCPTLNRECECLFFPASLNAYRAWYLGSA